MSMEKEKPSADDKNTEKIRKKARVKKTDDASMAFFVQAVLFSFFTSAVTFLLFLHKSRYPLIIDNVVQPEILAVLGGLFAFSLVTSLVFSLHRLLLNFYLSFLTGIATAYILGVLYPYNFGEYLLLHLPDFGPDVKRFLAHNGNMVAGVAAGLLMFILLYLYKSVILGFFTLPALGYAIFLMNASASRAVPEISVAKALPAEQQENTPVKNKNIVFLILSDHVGYDYSLSKWQSETRETAEGLVPFFVADFYKSNNFEFYPKAYVRYPTRLQNIGNILNPKLTETSDDLFEYGDSAYYNASNDVSTVLMRNDLFKQLKDDGYKINVYQTYPVDFCKNDKGGADKCITYPAPLGLLYDSPMSTLSKVMAITGQWANSVPQVKNLLEKIRQKLIEKRMISVTTPFFGNPMAKALPLGQTQVLTRLKNDVLKSSGKNVFFAHIPMPSEPYMYDSYCRLNEFPEKWGTSAPVDERLDPKGEKKRWQQYVAQTGCLYGQLNALMTSFKTAGLLKNTTVLIVGDKGVDISEDSYVLKNMTTFDKNTTFAKKNLSTVFAVYNPDLKKPKTQTVACDVATLTGRYLLGDTAAVCQIPDFKKPKKLAENEINDIQTYLTSPAQDARLNTASNLKKWYADWLEKGGEKQLREWDEEYKKKEIQEANKKGAVKFIEPPSLSKSKDIKRIKKEEEKTQLSIPVPEEIADILPEETEKKEETPVVTLDEPEIKEAEEIKDTKEKEPEKSEKEESVKETPEKTDENVKPEKSDAKADDEKGETPSDKTEAKEKAVLESKELDQTSFENDVKEEIKEEKPVKKEEKKKSDKKAGKKKEKTTKKVEKKAEPEVVEQIKEPEIKPEEASFDEEDAPPVPVEEENKEQKKPAKKTTADILLPETTAPDVWKLDNDKKSTQKEDTSATVSDLDDLEKMLLEIEPESKKSKPEENAAVTEKKETPAKVEKTVEVKEEKKPEIKEEKKEAVKTGKKEEPKKAEIQKSADKKQTVQTDKVDTKTAEVKKDAKKTENVADKKDEREKTASKKEEVKKDAVKPVEKKEKTTEKQKTSATKTPVKKEVSKKETKKVVQKSSVLEKVEKTPEPEKQSKLEKTSGEKALKTQSMEKRRPVTDKKNVDITREFVTKRTNAYGEEETFILIERTTVPNKVITPAQLDELIEKAQ